MSNTAPAESNQVAANNNLAFTKNIFANLDALRLSADAAAVVGTSEILSHVPIRKPNRHEFFRTRPEPGMWFDTGVFEDKEERETFFVTPAMREALVGEIKPVLLVPTMTRQGVLLLWPLKLPTEGPGRSWAETARQAAELAKTKWVRIAPDMGLGGYRIYQVSCPIPSGRTSHCRRLCRLRSGTGLLIARTTPLSGGYGGWHDGHPREHNRGRRRVRRPLL
jgi:hypothetical protein